MGAAIVVIAKPVPFDVSVVRLGDTLRTKSWECDAGRIRADYPAPSRSAAEFPALAQENSSPQHPFLDAGKVVPIASMRALTSARPFAGRRRGIFSGPVGNSAVYSR
jgi:hypothetical protein